MTNTTDEAAVRGLMDAFVNGWNAGDGEACGRPFAMDADSTARLRAFTTRFCPQFSAG